MNQNLPRIEVRTAPAPDVEPPPPPPAGLCDFCFGVPVTADYRLAERLILIAGEVLVHDHGHRWLACRLCELAADARDHETLAARARAAAPMADPTDVIGRLHGAVLRLIVGKKQVTTPVR